MTFCIERTVPSMEVCNGPDREIWTETIIQASYIGGSIRHALLSIQAYHESLMAVQSDQLKHRKYAQFQYSKTIASAAATRYQSAGIGIGELLLLGIILRSIEVFRNDSLNAFLHVTAGRSVLDAAQRSNVTSDLMHSLLRPVMLRLEYKSMPVSTINNEDITAGHGGIERARQKGHAIMSLLCHGILQSASSTRKRSQFLVVARWIMARWYRNVVTVTQRLPNSGTVTASAIYTRIQFFLTAIALRIGDAQEETPYQALTPTLRLLICLCDDFTAADAQQEQRSAAESQEATVQLSIGVELVATAFFVGSCCHDPIIRGRALRLLKNTRRREARWYSEHAAMILKWLIREEESSDDLQSLSEPRGRARVRLKNLQYFHNLGASSFEYCDPAVLFAPPDWIRIEYVYSSTPLEPQEHWIRTQDATEDLLTRDTTIPANKVLMPFRVDHPLMPSTTAMIVLAHRQGQQTSTSPDTSLFTCDAHNSEQEGCQSGPAKQCSFAWDVHQDSDHWDKEPQLCSVRNLAPEKRAI